jgi:hypothetical protein
MAIINTGMQRGTELTVTKKIGGVMVNGYPRMYKVTDAFGNYAAVEELAKLAVAEYQVRLDAFKTYVEGVENGVTVKTDEAYVENLGACPIA